MAGEIDGFDYGSKLGRAGFLAQPPLVLEGNLLRVNTGGATVVLGVDAGDGISVSTTAGIATVSNTGVLGVQAGTNTSVNNTDPQHPIVSASGVVESVVAGTNIAVDNTDPANPIVSATAGGQVNTVVAGTGITVNSTDPVNPIVSITAGQVGFIGIIPVTLDHTALAGGGVVTISPGTPGQDYVLLNVKTVAATSTVFAGGNRHIQMGPFNSAGTVSPLYMEFVRDFLTIGVTAFDAYPSGTAYYRRFSDDEPLVFKYTDSSPDYTSGSMDLQITVMRIS